MTSTRVSQTGPDLSGKIAVVTGAASGIGLAISEALAASGATVCGLDVRATAQPTLALSLECDLTDDAALAGAARQIEALGVPDIVIHCAAIGLRGSAIEMPLDDYRRIFEVNLLGAVRLTQVFGPSMVTRRQGNFLFVSSINADFATPDLGAYAASKAALDSLCKTLAVELAPAGVRVNTIRPASIDTPLLRSGFLASSQPDAAIAANVARHPLGRWGRPEDVAKLALFLVSDDADWITGAHYALDGGASVTRR